MGGCFGVERNITSLKDALKELELFREDVLTWVEYEEIENGLKRLAHVRSWLSKAKTTMSQIEDMLKHEDSRTQNRKLSVCGYSSKYTNDVGLMLQRVKDLCSEGHFSVVAQKYAIKKVKPRPVDPTIDQRRMVERVWDIVIEDGVGWLGLFGARGVGKTTLLCQINNEFLMRRNDIDIVIFVELGKDPQISKIQEYIGKRLKLYDEEWIQKTEHAKALDISIALKNMRYVLLLDDVMGVTDLRKIGIAVLEAPQGCHIIFTTRRNSKVCDLLKFSHMEEVTRLGSSYTT